jgi:hypothetical protein
MFKVGKTVMKANQVNGTYIPVLYNDAKGYVVTKFESGRLFGNTVHYLPKWIIRYSLNILKIFDTVIVFPSKV